MSVQPSSQLHYTHLFFARDGSIIPLIPVSVLPMAILPPPSMASLIALQEIPEKQSTQALPQLPPSPPASTPPPQDSSPRRRSVPLPSPSTEKVEKPEAEAGTEKKEQCAFFLRRQGCKRGDECRYLHDKSLVYKPQVKGLEEKWWRTGSGENLSLLKPSSSLPLGRVPHPTDPQKTIKTHCTFFLRFGECDYFPCKFSHDRPTTDLEETKVFDWNAKDNGVVLVGDTKDRLSPQTEMRAKCEGGRFFNSRIRQLGIDRKVALNDEKADKADDLEDDLESSGSDSGSGSEKEDVLITFND